MNLEEFKPFMLTKSFIEDVMKQKEVVEQKEESIDFLKPKQKKDFLVLPKKEEKKEEEKEEKMEPKKEPKKEEKKEEKKDMYYPKQKDSLFWCFYIIKYGFDKYDPYLNPDTTSFANEKEEKFKWISILREKKHLLKEKKLKNVKEDVEDELGNKERITMKTFLALCIVEKINILFVHKRKCFVLEGETDEEYHVVHCLDPKIPSKSNQNPFYALERNTTQDIWNKYKTEYFRWASFEKPIKAPSAYKVDELQQMAKQLSPNPNELSFSNKTKKELYEYILTIL
jgi:hypothetical protein